MNQQAQALKEGCGCVLSYPLAFHDRPVTTSPALAPPLQHHDMTERGQVRQRAGKGVEGTAVYVGTSPCFRVA